MEENVSYDFVMVAPMCAWFSLLWKKRRRRKTNLKNKQKKKVVVNTQIKIFPQNKTVFIFFISFKIRTNDNIPNSSVIFKKKKTLFFLFHWKKVYGFIHHAVCALLKKQNKGDILKTSNTLKRGISYDLFLKKYRNTTIDQGWALFLSAMSLLFCFDLLATFIFFFVVPP